MYKMEYTNDFENLIKKEGEKAECMSILHLECCNFFNFLSNIINLPIIILSAIVGLLNAIEIFKYQNIVYSVIIIFLGILKSIESYYYFAKRSETHRIISLNYKRINKIISIQLSIERQKRYNANHLFKIITTELQNITESEPLIPKKIINDFKNKYSKYDNVAFPAICNGLTVIKIHETTEDEEQVIVNTTNTPLRRINTDPYRDD